MINLVFKITIHVGLAHFLPIEEDFFFVSNEYTETSHETTRVQDMTKFTAISNREQLESTSSEPSNLEIEFIKDDNTLTAKIKTFGRYATAGVGFAIFSFVLRLFEKS